MSNKQNLSIKIMSFGYKYGMPQDVNFLQDVRFLPNPYYDAELKEKTGLCADVRAYVKNSAESLEYISRLNSLCEFCAGRFADTDKENFTIAIGCTGGRHRSVTVAVELGSYLQEKGYNVTMFHRDIQKDK